MYVLSLNENYPKCPIIQINIIEGMIITHGLITIAIIKESCFIKIKYDIVLVSRIQTRTEMTKARSEYKSAIRTCKYRQDKQNTIS